MRQPLLFDDDWIEPDQCAWDEPAPTPPEKPLFNLKHQNGRITVYNPATTRSKVFRVCTQPEHALVRPNQRLVSTQDKGFYYSFGVVNKNGTISLWNQYQRSEYQYYVDILTRPQRWIHLVTFKFDPWCYICNRPLTDAESIRTGIGPVCRKRLPLVSAILTGEDI